MRICPFCGDEIKRHGRAKVCSRAACKYAARLKRTKEHTWKRIFAKKYPQLAKKYCGTKKEDQKKEPTPKKKKHQKVPNSQIRPLLEHAISLRGSQRGAAIALGVSDSYICRILNGNSGTTLETKQKVDKRLKNVTRKTDLSKSEMARQLGIAVSTLTTRIRRWGLSDPRTFTNKDMRLNPRPDHQNAYQSVVDLCVLFGSPQSAARECGVDYGTIERVYNNKPIKRDNYEKIKKAHQNLTSKM